MAPTCFICGGAKFDHVTPQYRRCGSCGHETLVANQSQSFMLNDALEPALPGRPSTLERFQSAILDRFAGGQALRQLVDIGSGSGRFLFHNARKFDRGYGVEITPEAVNFSQKKLGLRIVADIAEVPGEIDVATAWHSLEHFPTTALVALLGRLATHVAADGCVVVSVPNASSFQYRAFRTHYAFFDVPAHLHQFTPDSLGQLFRQHGFERTAVVTSWPYIVFGYIQGLLNLAVPGHNHLYYRLKRGRARGRVWRDVASFALLPLAVPLGAVLALVEAACPARQAVLTYRFEKRA